MSILAAHTMGHEAIPNPIGDRHTAQFNEEQLLRIIDNIGKEKIAAIVSDAESAMIAAKRRIVSNYKHILPVRCIAHHINLVTKDITSLDWAKKTLKKCQKIVSFFHKSHCTGAALREEIINSLVFGGNLKSSVKTRWSTSWDVVEEQLKSLNVSKTALSIWKNQGGVKTSSDLLLVQLSLYRNFEEPFNEIYLDELDETFNQIALSITNGNDLFGQDDNLEDVSHLDNNCDEEVINLDGVNDSHLIITESIDLNSSLLTNNNILSNEIYEENDIDHGDTNFDIDELENKLLKQH
ncbi:22728_t:CDS:2 [Entrophospora sp. SA101]|nr:22728_t:CDS:2 [Entrophospora sp. SA101]